MAVIAMSHTSKEDISNIGLEIIAYAGDAQCDLIAAIEAARKGKFDTAHELHASAKQQLIDAHNQQTGLLSAEAGGKELDVTFIMVHAQDTLMTAMMLEKQTQFFIDEYERLHKLEEAMALH